MSVKIRKKIIRLSISLAAILGSITLSGCSFFELANTTVDNDEAAKNKARVIHTTDMGADPDDQQSLVRQLVMANDIDIEGIITSTGCWRKSQQNTDYVDKILEAYNNAYPNLIKHDHEFPTPTFLKSLSVLGQKGYGMSDVGSGLDSPGSQLIMEAVDKDDPRPIWLTCWGGCNTIAQALWTARATRNEKEFAEFISKIRIYDVLGQDDAGTWIAKTFPSIPYIRAKSVYNWQPTDAYLDEHIQSHGPLGEAYPDRKYATEGDTPAFLYLQNLGLNDPEKVDHGGWGGRFATDKLPSIRGMRCMDGEDAVYDEYKMYSENKQKGEDISRWGEAIHNDFQARMDWSVSSDYNQANHHPEVIVNDSRLNQVMRINVDPGEIVQLSAQGTVDPDGDTVSFLWWTYEEASTYKKPVAIQQSNRVESNLQVPNDASGKQVHVILEVKDNGTPSLTTYRRIILNVQ